MSEDLIDAAILLGKMGYGMRLSCILDDVLGTELFKSSFEKRNGTAPVTYIAAIPHFLGIAEDNRLYLAIKKIAEKNNG